MAGFYLATLLRSPVEEAPPVPRRKRRERVDDDVAPVSAEVAPVPITLTFDSDAMGEDDEPVAPPRRRRA
jgi:hypothetical protein